MAAYDETNCTIPGTEILNYYTIGLVLTTGSLCLLIYLLALVFKLANLFSALLCPISLSNFWRSWQGVKKGDYEHYTDELDFET